MQFYFMKRVFSRLNYSALKSHIIPKPEVIPPSKYPGMTSYLDITILYLELACRTIALQIS